MKQEDLKLPSPLICLKQYEELGMSEQYKVLRADLVYDPDVNLILKNRYGPNGHIISVEEYAAYLKYKAKRKAKKASRLSSVRKIQCPVLVESISFPGRVLLYTSEKCATVVLVEANNRTLQVGYQSKNFVGVNERGYWKVLSSKKFQKYFGYTNTAFAANRAGVAINFPVFAKCFHDSTIVMFLSKQRGVVVHVPLPNETSYLLGYEVGHYAADWIPVNELFSWVIVSEGYALN
jgi:hypothetical protein